MKVKITPGAEIDVLSPSDLETIIDQKLAGFLRPPQWIRIEASVPTLSTGATQTPVDAQNNRIYEVKPGYAFKLHRVYIDLDASTPGTPFTAANGYLVILRNTFPVIPYRFGTGSIGLPALVYDSGKSAPEFFNGDQINLLVSAGPTSAAMIVHAEGVLMPQETS